MRRLLTLLLEVVVVVENKYLGCFIKEYTEFRVMVNYRTRALCAIRKCIKNSHW